MTRYTEKGEGHRLLVAGVASVLVNGLFLIGAAWIAQERAMLDEGALFIAVTRVSNGVSIHPATSMRPQPKVQVAARPKLDPQPVKVAKVAPDVKSLPQPAQPKPAPSQGAHTLVLLARPEAVSPDFVVLPEGRAKAGEPLARQEVGNAVVSSPLPVAAVVAPEPATVQPEPASPPMPEPEPVAQTAPEPTKPTGPTRDAEASSQAFPSIPDSVSAGTYRAFVRATVEVAVDGQFTVSIVTSSGNSEVDLCVLTALKRWKWKPALKDGVPVASVTTFRYTFAVD